VTGVPGTRKGGVSRCISGLMHLSLSLSLSCALRSLADPLTAAHSRHPEGSPAGGGVTRARAVVLTALLFTTLAMALVALAPGNASAEEACPNATLRFGPSATLPDCRAYELVTPAVKEDNSFIFGAYGFSDGEHVYFTSDLPLPGAQAGSEEAALSSRTPSGWITTPLTVSQGPGQLESINGEAAVHVSFASDFSAAFIESPFAASPLDQNLDPDVYRVDIPSGTSSLESLPDTGPMTQELYGPPPTPGNEVPEGSFPAGNSADGSRVFFETFAHLPTAPGTPPDTHLGGYELYERYDGHTYVVGVLPDGSVAPCGAEAGNGGSTGLDNYVFVRDGSVSPDGSNVVFHTYADGDLQTPGCLEDFHGSPQAGALYLREGSGTPQARTVELPGKFYLGRTADGLKVFSDGGGGGNAEGEPIYEYDIPTGQVTIVGYGALLAYSANGSVVYYLTHPSQEHQSDGESQLMVYDDGVTKAVTGAGSGPGYAGGFYQPGKTGIVGFETSQLPVVTPDGSKLLFLDAADLTGYDTFGPTCAVAFILTASRVPGYCAEAYIYDLNTGSFTCVSCNPSGTPPVTNVSLYSSHDDSLIPLTPALLSEDGSRAFFQTSEALVPQDTSGATQVYEWENGRVYLLSSGQGGDGVQEVHNVGEFGISGVVGSELVGASSNGDDVFIATTDHLAPQVDEDSEAIYDVRVDGGFPYTPVGHGCDSGQCQGPQTPAPVFAPPPSATFVGVGNPAPETVAPSPKKTRTVAHKHKAKKRRAARTGAHAKRRGRK
jgi:hypothetical protein